MTRISFDVTDAEYSLIEAIVERGEKFAAEHGIDFSSLDMIMDLEACHANGTPLDFSRLLEFPDADFGHDLFGIRKYTDRDTGQLTDCFLPRCARPRG